VTLGVLAVFAAVAVIGFMAWRLRFGVDLRDEAYYSALPYRFVLGDRPFVDEMNLLQLPALLVYPLVKAYVALEGSSAGIVLFMRVAWIVFAGGLAAGAFAFLRTLMRWPVALVASLFAFVTVPYNIPSLSYDTLGMGLLAAGMLLGAHAVVNGRRRWWLIAAGLAHGLAAVAYPTLALGVVAYAAALVALYRRRAPGALAAYLGGLAPAVGALGGLVLNVAPARVRAAWRYTSSLAGYGGGQRKLDVMLQQAQLFLPRQTLLLGGLAVSLALVLLLGSRGLPALLLPAALLFPVHGFWPYAHGLVAITLIGVVGLVTGVCLLAEERARRLLVWGVLPALAAGLVTGYTSTNGFINAGIGFFPAVFATAGLLAIASRHIALGREGNEVVAAWAVAIPLVLLLAGFAAAQYSSVHRQPGQQTLSTRIPGGPFAGLYTTRSKARYEEQLRADVVAFVPRDRCVLFFNDFPAPYLMTSARPAAQALWLSRSDDMLRPRANPIVRWWESTGRYPDVAFRFSYSHYGRYPVVRDFIAPPRYRLLVQRPWYEVWVRRPG
jgi:hypothetical protein